jgi:hypothetical protein
MNKSHIKAGRPDIEAAMRGGDWTQAMDGEGPLGHATLTQALYWTRIYTEILAMEEKVLQRIQQLMAAQSAEARREVELTNVPVVVAQAERFRQRLGYWEARVLELDGAGSAQAAKVLVKSRSGKESTATTGRRPTASRRLPGR